MQSLLGSRVLSLLVKHHHHHGVSFPSNIQCRHLFKWLNVIFNHVDQKKIKELGPEVAAAEWLIRNGAKVKWSKYDAYSDDYNQLLSNSNLSNDFIVEIDASKSSINHVGFPYLQNLKQLAKIVFNETQYLNDKALILLSKYQLESLKHVEIISCYDVTDKGVISLKNLKSLNHLKLQNLSSVDDKNNCYNILKNNLTGCKLEWN